MPAVTRRRQAKHTISVEQVAELGDDGFLQGGQIDAGFGEDVGQSFSPSGEGQLFALPDLRGARGLELLLVQVRRFASQSGEGLIKFQQCLDFGVEHMPGDRFDQEVDCAQIVASLQIAVLSCLASEEDDGSGSHFVGIPNELSSFEPVHPRHVDVQNDDGNLALQQFGKRLFARSGRDDRTVQRSQHCAQQITQPRIVVDHEDCLGFLVCHRLWPVAAYRHERVGRVVRPILLNHLDRPLRNPSGFLSLVGAIRSHIGPS